MQQAQITITTINDKYVGGWQDDPDGSISSIQEYLTEHGVRETTKLSLETPEGTHFFNTDHVVAMTIETRTA